MTTLTNSFTIARYILLGLGILIAAIILLWII